MAKKQQKRCSQTPRVRKRLAAYSATAGAVLTLGSSVTLIMPESSEAKVIYTDVKPDAPLSNNLFNGAFGGRPFTIAHMKTTNTTTTSSLVTKSASANINFAAGAIYPGVSASALSSSTSLSFTVGAPNAQICRYSLNSLGATNSTGNFQGAGDRFIGVRFLISGQPHYGWIRIDVAAKCGSMIIKDYAYEDVPDTPIHLGAPAPVGGIVHDISDAGDASQE